MSGNGDRFVYVREPAQKIYCPVFFRLISTSSLRLWRLTGLRPAAVVGVDQKLQRTQMAAFIVIRVTVNDPVQLRDYQKVTLAII